MTSRDEPEALPTSREQTVTWLEIAGVDSSTLREASSEDVARLEREAKLAVYAAWDVHRSRPLDEVSDDASATAWAEGQRVVLDGPTARAAAWHIASDAAWTTAALPSGTMSREAFRARWGGMPARVRDAAEAAVAVAAERVLMPRVEEPVTERETAETPVRKR